MLRASRQSRSLLRIAPVGPKRIIQHLDRKSTRLESNPPKMPPVASIPGGQHGPSTFDKLKMGAMMGGTVGCIMGFIYGTFNVFRYGAGSQGVMRTIGQYMGASGATFGFFMAIGSVVRSDADPKMHELYMRAQRRPLLVMDNGKWRKFS